MQRESVHIRAIILVYERPPLVMVGPKDVGLSSGCIFKGIGCLGGLGLTFLSLASILVSLPSTYLTR